jgi:PAP2 superfamily
MNSRKLIRFASPLMAALICAQAHAGDSNIDHKWNFDNGGIWKRNVQLTVVNSLVFGAVAGGLWEGGETRLGRTLWQSIDSVVVGTVSSEVLKNTFQRSRPDQGSDPNQFGQGKGHYSFPSGEVTAVTAVVTPFVLEYGRDHPLVYALELLPVYDGIARLKSNAHWQTDVLAGFALGTAAGYYAHSRETPFILCVLPHGFSVGIRGKF